MNKDFLLGLAATALLWTKQGYSIPSVKIDASGVSYLDMPQAWTEYFRRHFAMTADEYLMFHFRFLMIELAYDMRETGWERVNSYDVYPPHTRHRRMPACRVPTCRKSVKIVPPSYRVTRKSNYGQ